MDGELREIVHALLGPILMVPPLRFHLFAEQHSMACISIAILSPAIQIISAQGQDVSGNVRGGFFLIDLQKLGDRLPFFHQGAEHEGRESRISQFRVRSRVFRGWFSSGFQIEGAYAIIDVHD